MDQEKVDHSEMGLVMGTGKGGSGTVESFWTVQRSAQPAKPAFVPGFHHVFIHASATQASPLRQWRPCVLSSEHQNTKKSSSSVFRYGFFLVLVNSLLFVMCTASSMEIE
jgi:hypothetical protein